MTRRPSKRGSVRGRGPAPTDEQLAASVALSSARVRHEHEQTHGSLYRLERAEARYARAFTTTTTTGGTPK